MIYYPISLISTVSEWWSYYIYITKSINSHSQFYDELTCNYVQNTQDFISNNILKKNRYSTMSSSTDNVLSIYKKVTIFKTSFIALYMLTDSNLKF